MDDELWAVGGGQWTVRGTWQMMVVVVMMTMTTMMMMVRADWMAVAVTTLNTQIYKYTNTYKHMYKREN